MLPAADVTSVTAPGWVTWRVLADVIPPTAVMSRRAMRIGEGGEALLSSWLPTMPQGWQTGLQYNANQWRRRREGVSSARGNVVNDLLTYCFGSAKMRRIWSRSFGCIV